MGAARGLAKASLSQPVSPGVSPLALIQSVCFKQTQLVGPTKKLENKKNLVPPGRYLTRNLSCDRERRTIIHSD